MPKACPSDKVLNPATGRCVSKTGKIGRALLARPSSASPKKASPKPASKKVSKAAGCVQLTASNTTPSQWKKYSTRASPPFPANECPEGMVQKGNDGNDYVVSPPNAKGSKRWTKVSKTASPKPAAKKASPKPAPAKKKLFLGSRFPSPGSLAASGCVQYTQANTTAAKFKKYSTRPSPPFPANECPEGMILKGNDGNHYVVSAPNAKGIKRWQKHQSGGRQQRGARQQRAGDNTGCYTQCNGYTGQAFADCYHDCMN